MKRLLTLFFVLALAAPSFAASTYMENLRNFFFQRGLAFRPDSTFVVPDESTHTGESASKIIYVDLNDLRQMWNLAAFRQREASSSYVAADGIFPTKSLIWITTGQDSIVIWDVRKDQEWMVFVGASNNMIHGSGVVDLQFLDGKLYFASGDKGIAYSDFVADGQTYYTTGGITRYKGDISDRNAASGNLTLNTSPAIVNTAANAVAAIRDPAGGVDEFGRPLHYWAVHTEAAGVSVYNPIDDAIYDDTGLDSGGEAIALAPDGTFAFAGLATHEFVRVKRSGLQGISADGTFGSPGFTGSGTGGLDAPVTITNEWTGIELFRGSSVARTGMPFVVLSQAEGLLISHWQSNQSSAQGGENALTLFIDDPYNWPPWSGAVGMSLALEDATEAFGNDLTNNNTVTFQATNAVIGSAANFVAASSMSLTDADVAAHTPSLTNFSVGCWFRREIDSGSNEGMVAKYDAGDGADRSYLLYVTAADKAGFVVDCGTEVGSVDGPALLLNTWYHLVGTFDGSNQYVYLDGVEIETEANSGTMVDATEPFTVGGWSSAGSPTAFFDGQIDQVFVIGRTLSENEVRWLYQRGLSAQQNSVDPSDALHADDVDFIATSLDGKWIAAGNQDSVTILNDYGIPVDRIVGPGTGNLQDVAIWAVQDTFGLAMAAVEDVQIINPKRNLIDEIRAPPTYIGTPAVAGRMLMGVPLMPQTWDAVVDSAGNGHFTNVQDAIDAVGQGGSIFIRKGTYPPFDANVNNLSIWGSATTEAGVGTEIDGTTVDDAIDLSGSNVTIANLSVRTTGGGGNAYDGIELTGAAAFLFNVYVRGSDQHGFLLGSGANHSRILSCTFASIDVDGIQIDAPRAIITSNLFQTSIGGISIDIGALGDNALVHSNHGRDTGSFLTVHADAENCSLAPNMVNGTITDNSGTSSVDGSNEIY